jgi:hypothetical protein
MTDDLYRPVGGYMVRLEGPPKRRSLQGVGLVVALAWTLGFISGVLVALLAH